MARALMHLAGGALVSVVVAWACAATTTLHVLNGRGFNTAAQASASGWRPLWPVQVPAEWRSPLIEEYSGAPGVRWNAAATGWEDPHQAVQVYRAGWPMAALRWTQWHTTDSNGNERTRARGAGPVLHTPSTAGRPGLASNWGWVGGWVPRQLPLVPEWPGFAVDTAIYAGGLWGILFTVSACTRGAVRARRARCGQCARCGYSRAGLAGGAACPECGAAA